MISGHPNVLGTAFNHLKDCMQHADDSTERFVLAVIEPALAVEMPKELVSAVYQMNNHEGLVGTEAGYPPG